MVRKRYRLDKVIIEPIEERSASWAFAGRAITGTEYSFTVTDRNYQQRNRWDFVVRVPRVTGEGIEVRPTQLPNDSAWAELDRRSLMFNRATRGKYRGQKYCLVALADPTGHRTKDVVHQGEKESLPAWFDQLSKRIKVKDTIRQSRGTDGHSLVAIVKPRDFEVMIRVYFALKVWILKEGFSLPA